MLTTYRSCACGTLLHIAVYARQLVRWVAELVFLCAEHPAVKQLLPAGIVLRLHTHPSWQLCREAGNRRRVAHSKSGQLVNCCLTAACSLQKVGVSALLLPPSGVALGSNHAVQSNLS
jgi:hypothetical protein